MKWWVEHIRPGMPSDFYVVNTPSVTEDGFYRQVTSFSAFRWREMKRRFPMDKEGKPLYKSVECCMVHTFDDQMSRWEMQERICGLFQREEPLAEFDSVWDFYKAVNYDYKKQRYIK